MKRILATTHDLSVTGAPIALWLLLSNLTAKGFEIAVVSPVDGPLRARFDAAGIRIMVHPGLHTDRPIITGLLENYDYLFANTLLSMWPVVYAGQLNKRILWYIQEVKAWADGLADHKRAATAAFRRADEVITTCEYARGLYQSWRKKPIKILPIGVRDRETASKHRPTDQVRLLMIASIQRNKGHDLALKALKLLKNPRVSLKIIGEISQPDYFQFCKSIPLGESRVEWAGPIWEEEKKLTELDACDIVLVPSRAELTSMVIHEAMMAGKPVIATAVGGVPEIIQQGVTGYLVRPGSSIAIADRVQACLADREQMSHIAAAGRDWVRHHRTVTQWAAACSELILGNDVGKEAASGAQPAIERESDRILSRKSPPVSRSVQSIEQAIASYQRAQFLEPDYFEAVYNLARTCHDSGDWEEATGAYQQAVRLRPNRADLFNNLGIVLCNQTRYEEGIEVFQKAIALRPDQPKTLNNLGNALVAVGLFDQAIVAYDKALMLRPNYPTAHLNLGLMLLTQGNFVRGWPEYEWRWRIHDPRPRLHLTTPWWDGDFLSGKTILLHNEQGLGDTIQFARYIPEVANRGGKVILICDPTLVCLLGRINGIERISTPDQRPPRHDVHCPMLSLPGAIGTTLANIPAGVPYLHADAAVVKHWEVRFETDHGLRVGLVWAGQSTHGNDRNRSVRLEQLAPLAEATNVRFFSLQKGAAAKQAKSPPRGMQLADWTAEINDFGDTAALIAHLDLVVTVDTAVAHLAGAMGTRVWLLVPFIPDWRWMLDRSDSPWYPTMRLFRQPQRGDWATPIRQISEALRHFRSRKQF